MIGVCELELANSGVLVLVLGGWGPVFFLFPESFFFFNHHHPLPSAQTHKMAPKNGDYQKEYNKGKQTKGTRRAARDVTEELVIELTKALPMRALFYHHLFFSALIGSLPVLHQYYELCYQTPLVVGWMVMGSLLTLSVVYSRLVEGNAWGWVIFSGLFYAATAYAATPSFFACYEEEHLFSESAHRWSLVVVLTALSCVKALIALLKWKLTACHDNAGSADLEEIKALNDLQADIDKLKADI